MERDRFETEATLTACARNFAPCDLLAPGSGAAA
jgi:hypothetical protein